MFWRKKKEPVKEKELVKKNRLTIRFTDKSSQWWEHETKDESLINHWQHFYKWFFCRKESDSYSFQAVNKSKQKTLTVIKRENIYDFRIDII